MAKRFEIFAERVAHNGAWRVWTLDKGHLQSRIFYGYTKRAAMSEFRAELQES